MTCHCTPFVECVNTDFDVNSGAKFSPGTVLHQMCDTCQMKGNGIILRGPGVYQVHVSATFTVPSASGSAIAAEKFVMYQDEREVPGANATVIVADGTEQNTLTIDFIVRNDGRQGSSITVGNDGPLLSHVSNYVIWAKKL